MRRPRTHSLLARPIHAFARLAVAAFAFSGFACTQPLDTTRVTPARGTLGEEIYKVLCGRLVADAFPQDISGAHVAPICGTMTDPAQLTEPRLRALVANRARLVTALDRTLPAPLRDELKDFLGRLVPLYDAPAETLPKVTRAAADVLDTLSNDTSALEALRRLRGRLGYRSQGIALGAVRPLLAYPQLADFNAKTLAAIDGGAAAGQWDALIRAVAYEMATFEPGDEGAESNLDVVRSLLLRESDDFSSGTPIWLVRRDPRGLATPAAAETGIRAPFVDSNRDGLADTDGSGRFVDATGIPLGVPTPFAIATAVSGSRDFYGRALAAGDTLLYSYIDADRTLLAALARQSYGLFAPKPVLLDLSVGLPALLGPDFPRTERYGAANLPYAGTDVSRGPIFGLLHAAGSLLPRASMDDTLAAQSALINQHEAALAGLANGLFYALDRANAYPAAKLEANSVFVDDVLRVLTWMSEEPGLTEAFLRATADPRTARLGQIQADLMLYRDRVSYDPSDMNAPRRNITFTDRVDRNQPDHENNQSLFQRSMMLIHDVNGVRLCNKEGAKLVIELAGMQLMEWPLTGAYHECELMQIDNAAELYAQAIIGRAEIELKDETLNAMMGLLEDLGLDLLSIDDLMEMQSGIDGFTTHPTPEAINRFIFSPRNNFLQNLVDPPVTRDGASLEARDGDTIFAWEHEWVFNDGRSPSRLTFYESLVPLIEAFDNYDRRTDGRFLFGELMSALHMHWGSRYVGPDATTQNSNPSAAFYAKQSNIRSAEELLADVFENGRIMIYLHELTRGLDQIQVRPGVDGVAALAALLEEALDPNRNNGFALVDGRTSVTVPDGSRAAPATPVYELLDALRNMDATLAADPVKRDRVLGGLEGVAREMLATVPSGDGYLFRDTRTRAVAVALIDFARERIGIHRDRGDLTSWSNNLVYDAQDTLGSPAGAAVAHLLAAMNEDPAASEAMARLLAYLTNASSPNDALSSLIADGVDILQSIDDEETLRPVVRALAPAAARNVTASLSTGQPLQVQDSLLDAAVRMLHRSGQLDVNGTMPKILANLVTPPATGESALDVLGDVIAEVNRETPGIGTDLAPGDYRTIIQQINAFMRDDQHGLERLYDVVQGRELGR